MSSRKIATTAVAVALSLFFLWLAFGRIDFKLLSQSFKAVNWLYTIPFIIITWVSFWWRALRWRLLLLPSREISSWKLFGPLMIGFGFNSIFPARAGEFARPLALTKSAGVPFTTGFSTVVLERVLDSLTLLGLFIVAPYFIDFSKALEFPYDVSTPVAGAALQKALMIAAGLAGASAAFCAALWRGRRDRRALGAGAAALLIATIGCAAGALLLDPAKTFTFGSKGVITPQVLQASTKGLSKFVLLLFLGSIAMMFDGFRSFVLRVILAVPFVPAAIKHKVSDLFRTFAEGFNSLRNPWILARVVFHSLMVWFLTGASFWVMSWGVPGVELDLTLSMAFLVITCVAILIPAAPGYWGLYEVGGKLALILCGAVANTEEGRAIALSYTLIVHFLQWALVTVIGMWYAAKIHVSAGEAIGGAAEEPA